MCPSICEVITKNDKKWRKCANKCWPTVNPVLMDCQCLICLCERNGPMYVFLLYDYLSSLSTRCNVSMKCVMCLPGSERSLFSHHLREIVSSNFLQMWYPCGSFKGDDRSAALTKSWADGGLLAGVSKKQLDSGIAGSLYRDQKKLAESIARAYPQLRKSIDEFEYGYKLAFEGLDAKKASEIFVVEPKESKGLMDNIKNIFSG